MSSGPQATIEGTASAAPAQEAITVGHVPLSVHLRLAFGRRVPERYRAWALERISSDGYIVGLLVHHAVFVFGLNLLITRLLVRGWPDYLNWYIWVTPAVMMIVGVVQLRYGRLRERMIAHQTKPVRRVSRLGGAIVAVFVLAIVGTLAYAMSQTRFPGRPVFVLADESHACVECARRLTFQYPALTSFDLALRIDELRARLGMDALPLAVATQDLTLQPIAPSRARGIGVGRFEAVTTTGTEVMFDPEPLPVVRWVRERAPGDETLLAFARALAGDLEASRIIEVGTVGYTVLVGSREPDAPLESVRYGSETLDRIWIEVRPR